MKWRLAALSQSPALVTRTAIRRTTTPTATAATRRTPAGTRALVGSTVNETARALVEPRGVVTIRMTTARGDGAATTTVGHQRDAQHDLTSRLKEKADTSTPSRARRTRSSP